MLEVQKNLQDWCVQWMWQPEELSQLKSSFYSGFLQFQSICSRMVSMKMRCEDRVEGLTA